MNNRELFHATMKRENGNQLLHMEQGFNIIADQWRKDGLPKQIQIDGSPQLDAQPNLFDYMNVTGYLYCRFEQYAVPPFEEKVLSLKDGKKRYQNRNGVILEERVIPSVEGTQSFSPPHEIDFSIKTMEDYLENRERFCGNIKQRVDWDWLKENGEKIVSQQDYLSSLWVDGPFAFLRELLGTENAMVLPYEEPEMIEMMLKDHLRTSMEAAEPVIRACKPDMCFVWEDCCGSTGPFIAPSIFEEMFASWYREWKAYLTSMGVPWIMLDTDGDPSPLVKLWYESGVDCLQPWEVNGVDMLKFAEEYPEYVMMGGIYKHMFEPGDIAQTGRFQTTNIFEAIDQELERVVKPMTKRGGYIAALDHWAFWGTTFDGYRYYSNKLRDYGKANCSTRYPDLFSEK